MNTTVIRVGGDTPRLDTFADFLDGSRAVVQRASVRVEEGAAGPTLVIQPPEAEVLSWPLNEIRRVPDQASRDALILRRSDQGLARLFVTDEETKAVLSARCGKLNKTPPMENRGRLFSWGVGAIASVALIVFVLVPLMADQLAEYLPPEGEQALGDATFEQIRTGLNGSDIAPLRLCEKPQGAQALVKMRELLEAQTDLPYPLNVHVLDHPMINAFALPGGRVIIFRGLIDAAENPDEIAAVLAHEIGHVVNRDPARGALRSAGSIGVLGLLFGDFAGGTVVLFLLNRLVDATYSQAAESAADDFSHTTLASVGIAPSSLGTIFERLREKGGDASGIEKHFQAHPTLGNRIDAARQADVLIVGETRPSLDAAEWKALQQICQTGPSGIVKDTSK